MNKTASQIADEVLLKFARQAQHIDETTGEEFSADQPEGLPIKSRIGTPIGFLSGTIGGGLGGGALGSKLTQNAPSPWVRGLGTGGAGLLGALLGGAAGTGLGTGVDELRWINTPGRLESEEHARGLQQQRGAAREGSVNKTASQIVDEVLTKLAEGEEETPGRWSQPGGAVLGGLIGAGPGMRVGGYATEKIVDKLKARGLPQGVTGLPSRVSPSLSKGLSVGGKALGGGMGALVGALALSKLFQPANEKTSSVIADKVLQKISN